jgi:hypothetical protein
MSKPKELRGPDFTQGFPCAELRDGAMLQGHAEGEPELLARRGDEVFSVGAGIQALAVLTLFRDRESLRAEVEMGAV